MLLYGVVSFPGSERTFYFICLGFWAFFAFRAWQAVRWRRNGMEVIQLSRDGLELRMDHGIQQGRPTHFPLAALGEAVVPEPNPRSLLESMEQQFWVVGGDRIHLCQRENLRVWQTARNARRPATRQGLQPAPEEAEKVRKPKPYVSELIASTADK